MKNLAQLIATWVFVFAVSMTWCEPVSAFEKDSLPTRIGVVVSQNIRPYIEAVEGLTSEINEEEGVNAEVFFLDKFEGKELIDFSRTLSEAGYDLFIAIGPGAARFVWQDINSNESGRFYAMVLNPGKVLAALVPASGIPLNISARTQIEMIHRGIPSINRIGLLYDPKYNHDFFSKAYEEAASLNMNVEIVSLGVSSRKEIPKVLKDNWIDIDALWLIPDRTVISESIVQYVIKEALLNEIPVIGYNRFFYESGAALAFVFDYREIGRQCAKEALRLISKRDIKEIPPVFHVWVNKKVIKSLGIETWRKYVPPVDFGP